MHSDLFVAGAAATVPAPTTAIEMVTPPQDQSRPCNCCVVAARSRQHCKCQEIQYRFFLPTVYAHHHTVLKFESQDKVS